MIRVSSKGNLRALLKGQGHQYLDDPIADAYITETVDELVGDHPWPWRKVTREVLSSETIDDLDIIDQVAQQATGFTLTQRDQDALSDSFGSLLQTGDPRWWYQLGEAVVSYPVTDQLLTVTYYSKAGWVDGITGNLKVVSDQDSDMPIAPRRCQELIMLGARSRAKTEAQDFEQAEKLRQSYETRLEEERSRPDQVDEFRTIRVTQTDWA